MPHQTCAQNCDSFDFCQILHLVYGISKSLVFAKKVFQHYARRHSFFPVQEKGVRLHAQCAIADLNKKENEDSAFSSSGLIFDFPMLEPNLE